MSNASSESTNFDPVSSFFKAFNDYDLNKMITICAKDARVRFVQMGEKGEGGVRQVGASFWSGLFHSVPNLSVVVRSMFGAEQSVATEVIIGADSEESYSISQVWADDLSCPTHFLQV